MKRFLLSILLASALVPRLGMAAAALYENLGSITNPVVDAKVVVNKGYWEATSRTMPSYPYETADTLYFTNLVGSYDMLSGTMYGYPGFWFNYSPASGNGSRYLAASFCNDNGAVVQAVDAPLVGAAPPGVVAAVGPSHLKIWATNIVVKAGIASGPQASLIVGANGELEMVGTNINLATSGIEVLPVWNSPQGSSLGTSNFIPDIAISDLYWGRTNFTKDYPLFSGSLWNGSTARAQGGNWPEVQPNGDPGFTLSRPLADSYINILPNSIMNILVTNNLGVSNVVCVATNITKGAIFLGPGPGITAVGGFEGPYPNSFNLAGVTVYGSVTNVVTAQMETAAISVLDFQAVGGLGTTGILTSVIGVPPFTTSRPANYYVDRQDWSGLLSSGNNGYPDRYFFVSAGTNATSAAILYPCDGGTNVLRDSVTNSIVEGGEYASYGAYCDNVVSRPLPVTGGTVTNLPGRTRIYSENLDLTGTRFRAEGEIIVQSSHLVSSTNAVIDCEHLSYDLNSTNGTLRVQNLAQDTVSRFVGTIRLWSAVWSNSAVVILDSYSVDTNGVATPAPLTNTISISYHTLMVDATGLGVRDLPVTIHGFRSRSTNTVIKDNLSVAEKLLISGTSLTLDGNLTLTDQVPIVNPIIGVAPPGTPLRDFNAVNAPSVLYLTNHGQFTIPNNLNLGYDRATPYSAIVNTGSCTAFSISVKTAYLENRGSLSASGQLVLQTASGVCESGGSSLSGGNTILNANNLKFNKYQMTVNGGLQLVVTNALFDSGAGASNTFTVQNGFSMPLKPATGDLLGTTLQTVASRFSSITIPHSWAGGDRGVSTAGYTDNVALGKLVFGNQAASPRFSFSGVSGGNAIYVDLLDLTALGSTFSNRLSIDPSLTIYYAAAKLSFTPPTTNGIPQLPEEYIDGRLGGRLRWVRDFAGPNSSIAVLVNGRTTLVNLALRNSRIIDSNTNGIPNYYDSNPFSPPGVTLTAALVKSNSPTATLVAISWMATPNQIYQVEYSTNPSLNSWQTLLRYTNTTATNRLVSVADPNAPAANLRRFYRVGFSP